MVYRHRKRERVLKSIKKNGWIFDKLWIEKLCDIGLVIQYQDGYPVIRKIVNGVCKKIRVSRIITNCPPHLQVDHKNRNRADNRKRNLRCVTSRKNLNNKSKYKTYKYYTPSPCVLCGK